MVNRSFRRYLSWLLAFFLLLSWVPVTGFAEEASEPEAESTTEPTEASTEPSSEPTEATSEPSSEPTAATSDPDTEPTEEAAEPAAEEPGEPKGPGLYFGQLHGHSSVSSGAETVTELFQHAQTEGLDFYAITDHSDSFDNAAAGNIGDSTTSQNWANGKAAAQAVTGTDFVGIYGFEMSWPEQLQLGHISVFNTPGFQSWNQEAYKSYASGLGAFYNTLSSASGAIGQWNHPGNQYGTFSDFDHYSPETDRRIQLVEVDFTSDLAAPSGFLTGYDHYTRALDKGWHVSPANNAKTGRTVILAQTLTEEGLYDAIADYRVYATEDADLEIHYTLDGFDLGSTLKARHIGQRADIVADLYDPSDSAIGLVEVIVDGGIVAARQQLDSSRSTVSFSLGPDYGYYYLRITQGDGDIAVTAPVWVEAAEYLGISGLTCETAVPVQGEDILLTLTVQNRDSADFLAESLQILADGVPIALDRELTRIPADREIAHSLTFRYEGIGQAEITVLLSGTMDGAAQTLERSIPLSFRQSQQVTDILIDGSYGNAGLAELGRFKDMAAEEDIRVTVADSGIGEEMLETCRFLLVTAPSRPFSEDFLHTVSEYVRYGGSVLLCGQSAAEDGELSSAEELNRLLAAIGSTIRLNRDTLTDAVYNGGEETLLFPEDIASDNPWCQGITDAQVYRHSDGCSVSPGLGSALVTTTASVAVLCQEETEAGGHVFAAGSLLMGNAELREPSNIWDAVFANRTIAENLLGIGDEALALSTIRQARDAAAGTVLRIRGYVTAGTANQWNRFPRTLYIQDETGGIAVIPFDAEGIAVGTPVEITGSAEMKDGNRCIRPISHKILDAGFYRYLPKTGDWKELLDPVLHGGELVEVEGECTEILFREDGRISDIFLADDEENTAHVIVEDFIFSVTGENHLHESIQKEHQVRAMGILHVDSSGKPVIRVRSCEEVVYIPPRKIYINPKTGDWLAQLMK